MFAQYPYLHQQSVKEAPKTLRISLAQALDGQAEGSLAPAASTAISARTTLSAEAVLGRDFLQQEPLPPPGKRKRRVRGADFESFNGSCWSTARDYLTRSTARVVMAQELKLAGASQAEAEQWCTKNGWQAFLTSCTHTETGQPSAGVGIFVRSYIRAARLETPDSAEANGCGVVPHWAAAVHLDFAMRGGAHSNDGVQ